MHSIVELVQRIWASDELLAVVIASLLSAIGIIVMRLYIGRGKVGWGISHQYVFTIQNPPPGLPLLVYTRQIWVQNIGRSVAEGIEVVFGIRPGHYEIWPQRRFTELTTPSNQFILRFDNLNPREHFTITIMQTVNPPPQVTNVRWRGGVGRQVIMGPRQIFPGWLISLLRVLVWFGLFSAIYFVGRLFR